MKTETSNPVSKKNSNPAGKDRFGCREGSQANQINLLITGSPISVEQIMQKTGLGMARIRSHLKFLLEKGFAREEGGKFTDGSGKPAKAPKTAKTAKPEPAVKAPKKTAKTVSTGKAAPTPNKSKTSVKTQAKGLKNGKRSK